MSNLTELNTELTSASNADMRGIRKRSNYYVVTVRHWVVGECATLEKAIELRNEREVAAALCAKLERQKRQEMAQARKGT